jgi:hypothetical protein
MSAGVARLPPPRAAAHDAPSNLVPAARWPGGRAGGWSAENLEGSGPGPPAGSHATRADVIGPLPKLPSWAAAAEGSLLIAGWWMLLCMQLPHRAIVLFILTILSAPLRYHGRTPGPIHMGRRS